MIRHRCGRSVLAVALGATGISYQGTPVSQSVVLTSLMMVTPTTGWGVGPHALWRTTDGGLHWHAVTPPGGVPPNTAATQTLDGTTAWTAAARPDGVVTVQRTRDGGRTWAASRFVIAAAGGIPPAPVQLLFTSPRQGWLLVGGSGLLGQALALFASGDGGQQWTRIALRPPIAGLLGFGATTGWGISIPGQAPPASFVEVTHDGGRTWQRQSLPVSMGNRTLLTRYGPLSFATAQPGRAVLPVTQFTSTGTVLVTYATRDGGRRWDVASSLALRTNPTTVLTSFVDAQIGWALAGDTTAAPPLNVTADGARHWHEVTPNIPLTEVASLDVVTPRVGFVLMRRVGSQGVAAVLRTRDGGRRWIILRPQIAT